MPDVHPVRLPTSFYLPRYTRCGFETRDLMPWESALAYVTDGTRFGVQFRDGSIDWLIHPEGDGSRASQYRLDCEKLPPTVRVDADAGEIVREIWRENGALLATMEVPGGRVSVV